MVDPREDEFGFAAFWLGLNKIHVRCIFPLYFISLLLTQIHRFLFSSPSKPQHKVEDCGDLHELPGGLTCPCVTVKALGDPAGLSLFACVKCHIEKNDTSLFIKHAQDGPFPLSSSSHVL